MHFELYPNPASTVLAGGSNSGVSVPHNTIPLTTGTCKFLLTSDDEKTIASLGPGGTINTTYPRATHVSGPFTDPVINYPVPAGSYAGVSVSFKSGDPALSRVYGEDTVCYATGVYKYNAWLPVIGCAVNSSGALVFPPYVKGDWTSGYLKQEGGNNSYRGLYIPNWGWSNNNGAYPNTFQFPSISFHVTCATCGTIGTVSGVDNTAPAENKVVAYPNPADGQLNITYSLPQSSEVSVTLIDMLGQVVASQKIRDSYTGKVVINTEAIPDGIYIYILEADGERSTRRIIIAH